MSLLFREKKPWRVTWRLVVLAIVSVLCLLSLSTIPDVYERTISTSRNNTCETEGSHDMSWKNRKTLAHMVSNFRKMDYKQFKFVNYLGNRPIPTDIDELQSCKHIEHDAMLEHGNVTYPIRPNFKVFNEIIKNTNARIYKFLEGMAGDEPIESTFKNKWFMFGTTAEWLEQEQCYVAFSRLIISKGRNRAHPSVSLITAQAFDKDWNELYGKRIKYLDVETPEDFEKQLKAIDEKYNVEEDCYTNVEEGGVESNQEADTNSCIKNREERAMLAEEEKQELTDKYFRVYPTILDIPFKNKGNLDFMGPEDPKVIVRTNTDGKQEPLVAYNMNDKNYDRRLMFVILPHRKINPIVPLVDKTFSISGTQKNWTPFFHEGDASSDGSRGFVHVIQYMIPTTILRCSLDDGRCIFVFKANEIDSLKKVEFKDLRGGSSFIRVPQGIPELDGRKLWVGMIKSHIKKCGGATDFYRPHLVIMEEKDGKYNLLSLSSALHFDREVLGWDRETSFMVHVNVMSPNSISSWNIISHDHENDSYEDYMELSFSESDCTSYILTVRGVLDYILKILRDGSDAKFLDWNADDLAAKVGKPPKCVCSHLREHCDKYGAERVPDREIPWVS
ncbi:Hypothetical protein J6897_00328 [Nakaseomyces glabratus]